MRKLLIRADATPRMGTGHIMRCLALARAACFLDWEPILFVHAEVPWVVDRLWREGLPFEIMPGPPPVAETTEVLDKLLRSCRPSAAALDGYHFGPDCQSFLKGRLPLLVVDDYGHLPHYSADVLLNPNIGAADLNYNGDIASMLLGPSYALLRPEFAAARKEAEERQLPERPKNILLTLGGGNFDGHLKKWAQLLESADLDGKKLRVLAGSMNSASIEKVLSRCAASLEILTSVNDMSTLLRNTDLCLTAGGSTIWELCCLGVPFLTTEVAKNQKRLLQEMEQAGLAPFFSAETLTADLNGAGKQRRKNLMAIVDGHGALRVMKALAECT